MDAPHEVMTLCDCGDIDDCEMERYVSDVRLAFREVKRLREIIVSIWQRACEAVF